MFDLSVLLNCIRLTALLVAVLIISSCNTQEKGPQNELSVVTEQTKESNQTKVYGESDIVTSSLLDRNGDLWFGTTNEGVYQYDGEIFTNFTEEDGLCNDEVWSMLEDRDGTLWFGTANGLCKYDGKTFSSIPIPWDGKNNIWGKMCNPNIVMSLLEDKSGKLWLGTCGGGAYRYEGETFTSFLAEAGRKQSDSLYHNLIKSMTEDRDGNIWFTSLTHGSVSRYDGTDFTHFFEEDGLYDDMVFCSLEDSKGNLWFGCIQTIDGGLYRYDGNAFENFGKEEGLCDNFIMSLFEDRNGNIWIATGKGLCVYDGATFTPMFVEENHKVGEVRTFVEDKEGRLWFGGRYGRLWSYDPSASQRSSPGRQHKTAGEALSDFTHVK